MMILKADVYVDEAVDLEITFDGYIPFSVEVYGQRKHPPLYWRVGDGVKNMLEISVQPETRMLSSITLPIIDRSCVFEMEDNLKEVLKENSKIPKFCLDMWEDKGFFSDNFCDDFNFGIKGFLFKDSIMIKIGTSDEEINFIKYSDNFYLGITSDGGVSIILLQNLLNKEVERFLSCVS